MSSGLAVYCDCVSLTNWNLERNWLMKKWLFWLSMFATSLLNGAVFYKASASAMNRGIDGVDNQTGLLFIPVLWIMAIYALVVLNIFTLVRGRKIARNQKIALLNLFQLSKLSAKEKAVSVAFVITTCLLMLFGYSLFATEKIWAISYAITGGILLLLLYAWEKASAQSGQAAS